MTNHIPAELAQLIDGTIESLVQLEALLFLRRERARAWRVDEIAQALYIGREMGNAQLIGLERNGLLVRTSSASSTDEPIYQYAPRDAEMDRLVGAMAELYHERRVAVIARIYSKPVNKVQTFADAFRLKHKE
jgi:hypothetical protein